MKISSAKWLSTTVVVCICIVLKTGAALLIETLHGPVSGNEIASFKNYMQTEVPPITPWGDDQMGHNAWGDGAGGRGLEALGLMFEVSGDRAILNQMIQWTDFCVSQRNDSLPAAKGGQRTLWTGRVEKVWCPESPTSERATYAGCETEDVIAHIGYCALEILKNRTLWNVTVPDRNLQGYGVTYLDRAKTYIAKCDAANDEYFLKWFVQPGSHLIRPPTNQPAWMAFHNNVDAINRQMMFDGGYQRLAECHEILGDDPARVAQYDAIVKASVTECLEAMRKFGPRQMSGHTVYAWSYYPSSTTGSENVGHAAYDVLGIYRACNRPVYGITKQTVEPLANTLVYVISKGTNTFAMDVDGGGKTQNYMLGEWIFAAEWNPAVFDLIGTADLASGRYKTNPYMDAAILWMKHRRATRGS
jgi:hypothetical protein